MFHKLKLERNLYKQYNIAAIKAHGVDNLPRRWKKLSPINRLKTKLKVDRYQSLEHERTERASAAKQVTSPISVTEAGIKQPQSTRNMFKSLISS